MAKIVLEIDLKDAELAKLVATRVKAMRGVSGVRRISAGRIVSAPKKETSEEMLDKSLAKAIQAGKNSKIVSKEDVMSVFE